MDKEKKKKMEQKNELTNSGQRFPVELWGTERNVY